MTMPHLMNCGHSDTGWCLDCVKEMYDENEREHNENQRGFSEASADREAARQTIDTLTSVIAIAHDWLDGNWRHGDADPSGLSKDEIIAQLNAAFIVGVTRQ